MAVDLGNNTVSSPRSQFAQFLAEGVMAGARPSMQIIAPEIAAEKRSNFLQNIGQALAIGGMAYAEGMGAGNPYSTFMKTQEAQQANQLAAAKAQEDLRRWKEEMTLKTQENARQEKELKLKEGEAGLKGLIKNASDIDLLMRVGAITPEEGKKLLMGMSTAKGEMAGAEALAKERAMAQPKVKDTSRVMGNFFNDLDMSYGELQKNAPESLKTGAVGALSRTFEVPFKKTTGELSQTKALGSRMSKIVYPMAKSYDPGGRLAKDDITAFAEVLGTLGTEASSDVAVKASKELRDLQQVMNDKGVDGDAFVRDFLAEAEKRGGFYAEIANKFNAEKAVSNKMSDDDAYAIYLKTIKGK